MDRNRWYGPLVRTSDWAWRILVILALIALPTFVVFIASTVGVLLAGAFGAVLAIPLVALVLEAQRIFIGPGDLQPDRPAAET